MWLIDRMGEFFNWFADNWGWIQIIVYTVITLLCIHLMKLAIQAIITGIQTFVSFMMGLSPLYLWIILIGLVIAAIVYMTEVTGSMCEAIYQVCLWLALAIIGVLLIVLAVYIATGVVMLSIPVLIGLIVVGILLILIAAFVKFTGEICGGALGIWEVIKAVCTWVGNAWNNMCNNLASWFWNSIADMLDGVDWLLKGINKIREALGDDPIDVGGIRAKADSYKNKVVENDLDISGAWSTGYNKGYAIGEGIQNKIDNFGNKITNFSIGDALGNIAGTSIVTDPGVYDPSGAYGLGGAYDMNKALGNIADDTDSISKNMDLTAEDFEYLRKIAEQEWKKEYTTAEIRVDMTNYNTINDGNDLDGLFTRLSEELCEELNIGANGVYA
jgi:hypothetical protein